MLRNMERAGRIECAIDLKLAIPYISQIQPPNASPLFEICRAVSESVPRR